jgi:hypothetical protein
MMTELYVAAQDVETDIFSCAYILGEMYHLPTLRLPALTQLRELWGYLWSFSGSYASCDFQHFLEKRIEYQLEALATYAEMLENEFVPFEYALRSSDGLLIWNVLYEQATKTHTDLVEEKGLLAGTRCPLFMVRENYEKTLLARRVIGILKTNKPASVR